MKFRSPPPMEIKSQRIVNLSVSSELNFQLLSLRDMAATYNTDTCPSRRRYIKIKRIWCPQMDLHPKGKLRSSRKARKESQSSLQILLMLWEHSRILDTLLNPNKTSIDIGFAKVYREMVGLALSSCSSSQKQPFMAPGQALLFAYMAHW